MNYSEIDDLTLDSYRFEQVEYENLLNPPPQSSPLQNLLDTLFQNQDKLEGDVKVAFEKYWENEIATMEF